MGARGVVPSLSAAGAIAAGFLAVSSCESSVVDPPPAPETLPCTVTVEAELAAPVEEEGSLDDLIAVDDGYVVAKSTLEHDRATLTRLSRALDGIWTVELPTTLEDRPFGLPGTRLAAVDGGDVLVAAVTPGGDSTTPTLEIRRVDAGGSTAWVAALEDTPRHVPLEMKHRDDVTVVLFRDVASMDDPGPITEAIARVDASGAVLDRWVVPTADPRSTEVRALALDEAGRIVLGGRRVPSGSQAFALLAAFATDGAPAWTWEDERRDHARSLPFARVDGRWLVAVGDRDAPEGGPGTVVIDDDGRETSRRALEPFSPETAGVQAGRSLDVVVGSAGGGAFAAGSLRSREVSEVVLLRLEADGTQRWRRVLDDELFEVRSMIELTDGGIIVGGFQHDGSRGGDSVFRLWRTDAGGRLRWTHDVRGLPGEGFGPLVVSAADGSIVVAASVEFDDEGRTTVQRLRESCTD